MLILIWSLVPLLSQVLWVFVGNIRSPRLFLLWNLLGLAPDLYIVWPLFPYSRNTLCPCCLRHTGKLIAQQAIKREASQLRFLSDTLIYWIYSSEITKGSRTLVNILHIYFQCMRSGPEIMSIWTSTLSYWPWVCLSSWGCGPWTLYLPSIFHNTFHLFSSFSSVWHSRRSWSFQHLYSAIY